MTKGNEQFIVYDGGNNDLNCLILFALIESIRLLARSNTIFSDGMFRAVPRQFMQLYTVHVVYMDNVLPLVYMVYFGNS